MISVLTRSCAWLIHRVGLHTLLSLALLQIALGSAVLGLTHTVHGLDAGLLLPVVMSGVLIGWMLARSPLPGWLGSAIALSLGAGITLIGVGRLGERLITLLRSLLELAWGLLRWPQEGPPDGSIVVEALTDLVTATSTLLDRMRDWTAAMARGEAAFDPVATALVWSLALWAAAVWASWSVRRHDRPLQGIFPAGVLLAISLSYTWESPYSLQVLLAALLLLILLTGQAARERRWQASGMDFPSELRYDLAVAAVPVVLVLMTATMFLPSVSIGPIKAYVQDWIVENLGEGKQLADSMGLETDGGGSALGQARAGGLPNRRLIGSGPELSEQVVMLVHTGDAPAARVTGASHSSVPATYWRSLTYDQYTGRGWDTSETELLAYRAGEPAISGDSAVHRKVHQTVQAVGDLGGLLYRVGELLTADHDYSVAWRSHDDAFGAEIEAQAYQVDSLVPFVGEAQLRAAGTAYPEWVRDRYLALPSAVPARVLELARDLTGAEPTPYDQARAIESYLRTFNYNLDLPAPPPTREIADYFLFDLQQGYCDYYATAMVVLARAAGLPARLVVGYAGGAYDAGNDRYVVTAADAHSWVELFFAGYGWVEFEPTGARPPLDRPADLAANALLAFQDRPEAVPKRGSALARLAWQGALGGLVVLGLGGLAWWLVDRRQLRRLPPHATVTALYQRLYRFGGRLAVPVETGDTPYEFAAGLTRRMTELAQDRALPAVLASISQVHWLTALYVRGLYSPHEPSAAEKAQAILTWQRLRRQMWRMWARQRRT